MKATIDDCKLSLIQGDITKQNVDAIVNAANSSLMGGGGVDGAIHRAGGSEILKECEKIIDKIGRLSAGEAVITTGGNLKARYVIHTVGPIWRGGAYNENTLLKNAYYNSLKIAKENNLKSVAFPSISTGAYRFPVKNASIIAVNTIINGIKEFKSFNEVRMVLFGKQIFDIYAETLNSLNI